MTFGIPRRPGGGHTALTVVAALLLSASLALSSLAEWAAATVLDADFVKPRLREAGFYRALREETLPGWIDGELRSFGMDEPEHRDFVKRVFLDVVSEDALRTRIEPALDQALPYLAGETDTLTIRPRLSDFALAVPRALARLEFPTWMVRSVLAPRLRPALDAMSREPLALHAEPGEAERIATEIAPPAWVDAQVVGATYAVARWATTAQRTFQIRIDYTERVDAATDVFKRLLRRSDIEQVLIERVVLPMAEQGLAGLEPFHDAEIDRDALAEVVRDVAPRGWLARQVDGLIDALGEWLAGRTDEIDFRVSTGALSSTAGDIVVALARRTLGDVAAAAVEAPLRASVQQYFPAETSWSTDDLRSGIGDEAYQQLLRMRGFVTEGFTYDEDDLRRDLRDRLGLTDPEIDQARNFLGASYAYTEVDLDRATLDTEPEVTLSAVRHAMQWTVPIHFATASLLILLVLLAGPGAFRRAVFVLGTVALTALATRLALVPYVRSVLVARAENAPLAQVARDSVTPLATVSILVFAVATVALLALAVIALRARAIARS